MVNWNSTALESKPNECKMHLIKQMESNIDTTLSAPANNIFVSKLSKMTNIYKLSITTVLYVCMTEQNRIYRLIWLWQSVCDYQKHNNENKKWN